jgi:hypothetical protein
MVAAGLRLQTRALADTRAERFAIREGVADLSLCKRMLDRWQRQMSRCGVARRSALKLVRTERQIAKSVVQQLHGKGDITRSQRARRTATIIADAGVLIKRAVHLHPRLLMPNPDGWLIAVVFWAWARSNDCCGITLARVPTDVQAVLMGSAFRMVIGRERQVCQTASRAEMAAHALHATRQWLRLGGWWASNYFRRLARVTRAAKEAAAQRQAFATYWDVGTLSGAPPGTFSSHIRLDFVGDEGEEPFPKRRRKRATKRQKGIVRARWAAIRAAAEGELRGRSVQVGDCRERYPVREVMGVRVLPGRGRRVEALIRWEGDQWEGCDSWEPVGNLSSDLRAEILEDARRTFPIVQSRFARRAAVRAALRGGRLRCGDGSLARSSGYTDVAEDSGAALETGTTRKRKALLDEEDFRRRARRRRRVIHTSSESELSEEDYTSE